MYGLVRRQVPLENFAAQLRQFGIVVGILLLAQMARAADNSVDPQAITGQMTQIDEFVRAEMERQKIPGVAIGIVSKGKAVAIKGYGLANVELGVPVTGETVFESGSVGKQFTSTVVMLMVEDGKLALDDSITKYFTDAPASWRPITVRNLLTHTSGIPNYEIKNYQGQSSGERADAIDLRRDYTEEELTKFAYRLPLDFLPGSRWSYSNTGYVILGVLIHKVSGQFYGDILRERVFKPLGMKSARVISEEDIVPHRAAGYRLVDGQLKNQEWTSPTLDTTADGSLYLSMMDFVAWDRGLRAGAILKPQSWAQINTPVTLKSGKSYPYGFGWQVGESNGKPWYYHGGAWLGFMTYISRYLADDLTILVLTNRGQSAPQRFVDGIAAVIDPKLARIEPVTPIRDSDPKLADRVRILLETASEGKLSPQDLPYVHDSFARLAKIYADLLRPLGKPSRLDLLDRRDLGDDRMSTYEAVYAGGTFRVTVGLAPDGRFSAFWLQPE